MKSSLQLALLLLALGACALPATPCAPDDVTTPAPDDYVDRRCGDDLSNLWLDVVAVVDNSKGMTNSGLTKVAANIASVFSMGTRIGTDPNEPRTTRVGLVTYNEFADIKAGLDVYQSLDDLYDSIFTALSAVSSTDESYLARGLAAAEQVFKDGATTTVNRTHYKKVVVVYASSYKGDGDLNPVPVADRLKTNGAAIITVAFDQDDDGALLDELSQISSANYSFSSTDLDPVGEVQGSLLQINCFCPNGWTQYRVSYANRDSYRYGLCLAPSVLSAVWTAAKMSCRNQWNRAYLVNEYDLHKHNYVLDMVKNTTAFHVPYIYHIGMSYSKGAWYWEQPIGTPLKKVQRWNGWNPGYPVASSTLTAGLNIQPTSELVTGWENTDPLKNAQYYVCEVISCDTDNYCSQVEI